MANSAACKIDKDGPCYFKLPIFLTNKKFSAITFMFFKRTLQKKAIVKIFQRAVTPYWVVVGR